MYIKSLLVLVVSMVLVGCHNPNMANGNKVDTFSNLVTLDIGNAYDSDNSRELPNSALNDNKVNTFSRLFSVRIGDTYTLKNSSLIGRDLTYIKGIRQ